MPKKSLHCLSRHMLGISDHPIDKVTDRSTAPDHQFARLDRKGRQRPIDVYSMPAFRRPSCSAHEGDDLR